MEEKTITISLASYLLDNIIHQLIIWTVSVLLSTAIAFRFRDRQNEHICLLGNQMTWCLRYHVLLRVHILRVPQSLELCALWMIVKQGPSSIVGFAALSSSITASRSLRNSCFASLVNTLAWRMCAFVTAAKRFEPASRAAFSVP
jgi:hypothetical protein